MFWYYVHNQWHSCDCTKCDAHSGQMEGRCGLLHTQIQWGVATSPFFKNLLPTKVSKFDLLVFLVNRILKKLLLIAPHQNWWVCHAFIIYTVPERMNVMILLSYHCCNLVILSSYGLLFPFNAASHSHALPPSFPLVIAHSAIHAFLVSWLIVYVTHSFSLYTCTYISCDHHTCIPNILTHSICDSFLFFLYLYLYFQW